MHLVVNVNSRECEPELLGRLAGAEHFPERSLGWSILATARDPERETVVLVAPDISDREQVIDYYCRLGAQGPDSIDALRDRIEVIVVNDGSRRWLSDKLVRGEGPDAELARNRIRARADASRHAGGRVTVDYFEPSENLERLAADLSGLPSQAASSHIEKGQKAYSRALFRALGIPTARGTELRHDVEALVPDLLDLQRDGVQAWVLKLNGSEYAAGYGNAFFELPQGRAEDREGQLRQGLPHAHVVDRSLGWAGFAAAARRSGVLAEERLVAAEFRSPSFQGRIEGSGEVVATSTHEQHFTPDGTGFIGCSFPAAADYRAHIVEHGLAVGRALADRGVERGGYGVDFIALRDGPAASWRLFGCEVNLRDTGTKHPFETTRALIGEPRDGAFGSRGRVYLCSDSICKPAYRGLRPGRLIEAIEQRPGLHYQPDTRTGVVLHMFGSLLAYGKIGATCIAENVERASALRDGLERLLDELCAE